MISALYASLLGLLIVWQSLRVIKLRQSKKISLGDGGEAELQIAIRAQGNTTEYVPISLILLILLELNKIHFGFIHCGGIAILLGRLFHDRGLLSKNAQFRVLGMQITLFTIITLALTNFGFVIYGWVNGVG